MYIIQTLGRKENTFIVSFVCSPHLEARQFVSLCKVTVNAKQDRTVQTSLPIYFETNGYMPLSKHVQNGKSKSKKITSSTRDLNPVFLGNQPLPAKVNKQWVQFTYQVDISEKPSSTTHNFNKCSIKKFNNVYLMTSLAISTSG